MAWSTVWSLRVWKTFALFAILDATNQALLKKQCFGQEYSIGTGLRDPNFRKMGFQTPVFLFH